MTDQTEALRAAAQAIVDDWLTTFGPDGYASQMPPKLRALRAALATPSLDVERLARALLRMAYPWHDIAVDDPPVMDVGDLSSSGTETPQVLAQAIAKAYAEESA